MVKEDRPRSKEELLNLIYLETNRFLRRDRGKVGYVELKVAGPTIRRNREDDPRRMTHGATKYSFDVMAPVDRLYRIIASVGVYVSAQRVVVETRADQPVSLGEDFSYGLQNHLDTLALGI